MLKIMTPRDCSRHEHGKDQGEEDKMDHQCEGARSCELIQKPDSKGIGLALSGGAARGLVHIGVLKVIEEEGIPVDYVAGTSAGSLIGAAYCAGWSWKKILEKARGVNWRDIASPTFPRMGLLRMTKLQELLEETFGGKEFKDLVTPLSVVTADLVTGEQVVLSRGSMARALRASCSIPGLFEPVLDGERSLVDGGLVNNVPVDVARQMGAKIVVGVNLNSDHRHPSPPRNILEVLLYSFEILLNSGPQQFLPEADIIIAPRLGEYSPRDFRHIDELVAIGESAMHAQLGNLKQILRSYGYDRKDRWSQWRIDRHA